MRSIYIGQLLQPAAAHLIMRMRICLGGVANVCDYLHPAVLWDIFFYLSGLLYSLNTFEG